MILLYYNNLNNSRFINNEKDRFLVELSYKTISKIENFQIDALVRKEKIKNILENVKSN